MLLSLMPIEETGERGLALNVLNVDASPCAQIKKQISIRGKRHWYYIFVGI